MTDASAVECRARTCLPERGIRVRRPEHGEATEFQPGKRQGTLFCPDCGVETEADLRDPDDWRDWGERC